MKYTPNQINKWMLFKLPAAWLTGVRISLISETKCEVKVRFKWINQNPYRSMYWGVEDALVSEEAKENIFSKNFLRLFT